MLFDSFRKLDTDLYQCDMCHRTVRRKDTLILYNRLKRRKYRMCRDCQLRYYMEELKDLNPSLDIKLKASSFYKDIKSGK